MKKLIFIQIILLICFSCRDSTPLGNKADFESFTFSSAVEGSVFIDPADGIITAGAIPETDMEAIVPVFVLSQGAKALVDGKPQTSGETQHDFTNSVEYTLISGDGKTVKTWTVRITKEYPLGSVWKVKAWRIVSRDPMWPIDVVPPEEPVEFLPPADAVYPYYKIEIPDFTEGAKGITYGNSFLNPQWFEYEIKGRQQIYIRGSEYLANQLSVTFKNDVDLAGATEFAANSNHRIFPERGERRWWLFNTDGTENVLEIINDLNQQQHPNVESVWQVEGIKLRDINGYNYMMCIFWTEKFKFSGNELIFMNAQDKPLILFERIEKE